MESKHTAKAAARYLVCVDTAGRLGLYVLALSLWMSTAGAYIGLSLLLVATLLDAEKTVALLSDPMLKIIGVFAAYLALHAAMAIYAESLPLAVSWRSSWRWLKPLVVFVLLAVWLEGDERRIGTVLVLAFAGLVAKMVFQIESAGFSAFLQGARSGLGFHPTFFGLYAATALLGLVVLAPRLRAFAHTRLSLVLGVVVWCVAFLVLLQGLIVSQTRNSWISVLVVYPLILAISRSTALGNTSIAPMRRAVPITLLTIAMALPVVAHNGETIKQRALQETEALQAILRGDLSKVKSTGSIGLRVGIARYGVEKWSERPLLGWGPHASLGLITQSDEPQLQALGHFHNTYLEVAIQLGILGAAFFVLLNLHLAKTLFQALRSRQMSRDYALYVIGGAGLLMISSLSDFGVPKRAWAFHIGLLAAIVHGYALKGRGAVSTARLRASAD